MSTATCPRPITSLPPLLSAATLAPESFESAPEPESVASNLVPMPVEGGTLPFYLDPRGGVIDPLEKPAIAAPRPAPKPACVDPRPFVNCYRA